VQYDRRPPNVWFIGAWVLLVVIVAFGFYVQARTISRLERDEQAIQEAIREENAGQRKLCGALLDLAPEELDARIISAFAQLDVDCESAD
jgi:hypothetical protein